MSIKKAESAGFCFGVNRAINIVNDLIVNDVEVCTLGPIIHNMEHVDIVVGVVGILCANSMMGELSPAMAQAIGGSHTHKVLLPVNRCHIQVVSVAEAGWSRHIKNVIEELKIIMD